MDISIVDICPTPIGKSQSDAMANAVDLARRAEALGYKRYWLAEHHGTAANASQAPEILIAHLAAATSRIRVGSGAVLLNHYSPFKVAEQFRTLHALHPGRIDLGVGRAFAGPVAEVALQRHRDERGRSQHRDDYAEQVFELLCWNHRAMPPDHPFATLDVSPDVAGAPEMLLLGSSQSSPMLAGQLGLPYVFAGFIAPHGAASALASYARAFQPSQHSGLAQPHPILAMHVVCADSQAEAERLAMPVRHLYAELRHGRFGKRLASAEEAIAYFGGVIAGETDPWPQFVVGDKARVGAMLGRMIEEVHPEEIVIQDMIMDHEARAHSHRLIAEIFR